MSDAARAAPELRDARPDDAAAIAAIYAPFVAHTAVSFEAEPPTADDMRTRIVVTTRALPWLVATHDGDVVGYAYAAPHHDRAAYRWSVNTSIYVAEPHRGAGTGRLLYRALIERLTGMDYVNAYAGIALPNPASVALHESLGFALVGVFRSVGFKLGAWHDVGWWWLQLRTPPRAPSEPSAGSVPS